MGYLVLNAWSAAGPQIDGGGSVTEYALSQNLEGGDAASVFTPMQIIDGGRA